MQDGLGDGPCIMAARECRTVMSGSLEKEARRGSSDQRAAELGEADAAPAAIAVQRAHVLGQTRRPAQRLQKSLVAQMVIEQAIGVVVGREGIEAGTARCRRAEPADARGDDLAVAGAALDATVRRAAGRGPADR